VIASLHGSVTQTGPNFVVLEVAGVGYLVNVVPQLSAASVTGQSLNLHTRLVVREDAMTLFGFESAAECQTFDLLTSVTGVGPKLGLAIIASLSLESIESAVANELDAVFKSVPGIGAKTAKLIAVTLAGRLSAPAAQGSADVMQALVGLGYSQKAASGAVAKIGSVQNKSSALKLALAHLSGSESIDRT
jgi:Holliday junction DNA helicase RuvA